MITSGPVNHVQALEAAKELETALLEVMNGKRKPGKVPMEPMARLIQYTRENERLLGKIAYQLTKRLVIDMPTARAAVDAAYKEINK